MPQDLNDPAAITARLAELRREASLLLSQLNTAYLPTPTYTRGPNTNFPGPEWQAGRRNSLWNIHVTEGHEDVLYVHHPGDIPGDVQPMELDYAQEIAMALLAACHYANLHHTSPDVPVLANFRRRR